MRNRVLLLACLAALLGLTAAAPVLAGGWAVTVLDSRPSELRAGDIYRIGYTILQHGKTPLVGAERENGTWLRISPAAGGESHTYFARPEGEPGHYVAEVRFPAAGEWVWEVNQGPFGPQRLGSVTVAAGAAAALAESPAASASTGDSEPLSLWAAGARVLLPVAAALAAALFAWQLALYVRATRARAAQAGGNRSAPAPSR